MHYLSITRRLEIQYSVQITFTTLWANSAETQIDDIFSYFSQKTTTFGISSKLCMKCQKPVFCGK